MLTTENVSLLLLESSTAHVQKVTKGTRVNEKSKCAENISVVETVADVGRIVCPGIRCVDVRLGMAVNRVQSVRII